MNKLSMWWGGGEHASLLSLFLPSFNGFFKHNRCCSNLARLLRIVRDDEEYLAGCAHFEMATGDFFEDIDIDRFRRADQCDGFFEILIPPLYFFVRRAQQYGFFAQLPPFCMAFDQRFYLDRAMGTECKYATAPEQQIAESYPVQHQAIFNRIDAFRVR